jgi:DNA-binding MarR family transcriptional regulator
MEHQRGGIQCLMYISKKKTGILSDFINDLDIPRGSISRALHMLYECGLVHEERLKHKNKRQITITEFGEKVAEVFFDINKIMDIYA